MIALFGTSLFSQKIVVSEYFNATSYNQEWTELVVIEDNTSAVGFTLRDNSASSNLAEWMGGVKFKDVALWRHLRRGTIIVINHRNTGNTDDNAIDGYIELNAENSTYFDKVIYCNGCTIGNWAVSALSIAQSGEIMQLRDASDQEVHTLAHMTAPQGNWLSLSVPKISSNSAVATDASIRVVPGRSLTEYNVGFDNAGIYTASSTQFTKGRPNTSTIFPLENYKYWHILRKPDWTSPKVTATISSNGVDLSWNTMTDIYPADNTQGYLILKIPAMETDNAARPSDGRVYSKGEKLGSAIVVDNVFNSTRTTYSDIFDFQCGESYVYQIFAFRYNADRLGDDAVAFYQKGRIYNSSAQFLSENNFALSKILEKPYPVIQLMAIKSGNQVNCIGNKTVLYFYPPNDTLKIEWFKDNILLPGQTKDTLVATQSGDYSVKLTSKFNCSKTSSSLYLQFLPTPIAKIGINYKNITKDTTIIICNGNSLKLTAEGGDSVIFFRNNKVIQQKGNEFIANESGTYKAIAINQKQCADTSFLVFLKLYNIYFQLSKQRIDFILANNESSKDDSLLVNNLSSDTLFLDDIVLNNKFEILSPSKPYMVFPNSSKTFVVRFKTTTGGLFEDVLYFRTHCGKSDSVLLVGNKSDTKLISSLAAITYPNKLICNNSSVDTTIKLTNNGESKLKIYQPKINLPFKLMSVGFPIEINKGESISIDLRFDPTFSGDFADNLSIPYSSVTDKDTMKIAVNGSLILPRLNIENSLIDFATLKGCNDWIDTTISIYNPNNIDVKIQKNSMADFVIKSLPITLKSKEITDINLSFKISNSGAFDKTFSIISEPCSVNDSIRIVGNKSGNIFSFDKDTIDFSDIIINCGDSTETVKLNLNVIDLSSNPMIVSHKFNNNLDNVFSVNLNKDSIYLKQNNEISITFSPNNDQNYLSELLLYLEPCGVEKRIILKGNRKTLSFNFDQKEIDFGRIAIPANEKKNIRITNNGSTNLVFSGITGINLPFSSNITFPLVVDINDNKLLEFAYNQSKISKDTQTVYLEMTEPCNLLYPIKLKAETYDKDIDTNTYKLTYKIGTASANVGDNVEIPVSIFTSNLKDLNKSSLISISSLISFNPTMLYPTDVSVAQSSKVNYSNFIEESPGKLLIETILNQNECFNDGIIYNLKFKVLYGNSDFTPITLDSFDFKSTKIVVLDSTQNGWFKKISGDTFDFDYILSAKFINYNQLLDQFKFEIFTPVKDKISIKFFNVLGQMSYFSEQEINSGKSDLIINSSNLPYGAYFVEISNGKNKCILNITVVR